MGIGIKILNTLYNGLEIRYGNEDKDMRMRREYGNGNRDELLNTLCNGLEIRYGNEDRDMRMRREYGNGLNTL